MNVAIIMIMFITGLVSIVASDIKIVYMSDDRLLIQITNISVSIIMVYL